MATTRIKDVSKTTTDLASDEYIIADGATNGTQKMARDDAYADWAAAYTAAPTTYKLAPLNSGTNKIDATYLPTGADTAKGAWDANANSPALADGAGTAGDYYDVTVAGSQDLGSGSIAYTVGDVVKYDGATWYKIDSVANFLDGYSTAATSRTALEVNSVDVDAEANGTKLLGPSVYFDGTNDVVTVAHDSKLNFTDGSNDLPFSVSAWINASDCTNFQIVNKDDTSSNRDWSFDITSGDDLRFIVLTDGSNYEGKITSTALTSYEGQWIHVAATFGGAGPDYASGFSAAEDAVTLYINGAAVAMATGSAGTHTGMPGGTASVLVGKRGSSLFAKGHIRNVQIYNRELTAAEIADLARGNELGFAEEWAGALGGVYTSNFSADSANGWTASGGTADATTTVGGDADVLQLTIDSATTNHQLLRASTLTIGKRYRISAEVYIPSTNASVDGVEINAASNSGSNIFATATTLDAWTTVSGEAVSVIDSPRVRMKAGSSYSFLGNGTDYIAIRNVKITEIGTLADFRSECFDSSTGKWYDLSDNAFVGTNSGATLVGREVPVYETGSWTPTITFGGGSTGVTYSTQEGYYTRIGDTVYVTCVVALTSKGTDTGSAVVEGLPFTARNTSGSTQVLGPVLATTMAGLTSTPCAVAGDAAANVQLFDSGASGFAFMDDTNFNNTSAVRFSGTYQIQ